MNDIYALLNIDKGILQGFHLQANHAVDHQTELAINRSIRTLKDIEERMMEDTFVTVSQQSIDEIMMKVIDNAKKNNQDMSIWSIRELRIVSYYLMKLQGNEGAYEYALTLLDANWRDMFFNGLSFFCLDTWNMIDSQLRILTCELLNRKLLQYKNGNKKYIALKNHANLFEEAGPQRLVTLLTQKKQDVKEAPSYFHNKPATLNQSYYSDVIVHFFNVTKITNLDYVESVLEVHKNDRTKKLVFANLVLRMNDSSDELQRTQLCKYANRILGDITLTSTWAPYMGATEREVQKLKQAKQLVNLWFNRKIIETFFEVCVQDRDRKVFWLNYVEYVSAFKIVGSTTTKRLLQGDSRVCGIFLPHFIETGSIHSQTSALVLFIKNKMIVEFSDKGALYVYNQTHPMVKKVTGRKHDFGSTADLKIPSMNNIVTHSDWGYPSYYEEGRMTHQGYWQDRLNDWMQRMVLSSTNTSVSFLDSYDNYVFQASPILKDEYKPQSQPKQLSIFDDDDTEAEPSTKNKASEVTKIPKYIAINTAKPTTRRPPKAKQPIYETKINWSIASKWIAHDQCRIVCNSKGFYANVCRGQQYVHLCPLQRSTNPNGSIWIKRPNQNGWQPVVHSTEGIEILLGWVKEAGGSILYKQELSQSDFMAIKL